MVVVPGLTAPVDILIDPWGVPHIYASTTYDLFLAQGFQAARDRLWQIDTWRRRGLGLLSEVWGGDFVEQDRAARLFLFRGNMHAEWLAYTSDTKRIATAFTAGINAYVEMTREDPALLPLEFRELGYEPSFWLPSDVVRIRSHCRFVNVAGEVARALAVRDFGYETEELRRWREPWQPLTVPPGLDLSIIPDDVLRDYWLATMLAQLRPPTGSVASSGTEDGSNNWVLAPTRTATGRPLLANDPHRAMSLPSLRYLAHLSAPEFDVIGAGEPAVPGISAGHNGHVAFGFTVLSIDQEDLYVYETRPGRPYEYRYGEGWERMQVVREHIPVRGARPADVDLLFTRHGPVVRELPVRNAAFAVRAAWLCPGMAPYLSSLEYMRARTMEQFTVALNRWGSPAENMVYADTEGNIAWKAAGLTPIRPNWDGTLPVPGDGRYEWAGFYDVDELPSEVNPTRGWIATANEMNLPVEFTAVRTVGYDWLPPYRRERIAEVLEAGADFTAADMVALQGDFVSILARRIVRQLPGRSFNNLVAARAALLLAKWDAKLASDSKPAAVFEVWYKRHLRPNLRRHALTHLLPTEQVPRALAAILPTDDPVGDPRIDLDLIENPGQRLGPNPDQVLTQIFEVTLQDAMTDLAELLGENERNWTWGNLHRVRLVHPASSVLNDDSRRRVAIDSLPRGGSSETVGATAYLPDFSQSSGATFRFVVDVGGWNNSLAMNSPGQSGDPASPHFTDLFAAWAADGVFPLLYTRDRIDEVAEQRVRLVPRDSGESSGSASAH